MVHFLERCVKIFISVHFSCINNVSCLRTFDEFIFRRPVFLTRRHDSLPAEDSNIHRYLMPVLPQKENFILLTKNLYHADTKIRQKAANPHLIYANY